MWNLRASSKIIQQRSRSKSYEIHRKKLKSMHAKMKNQSPSQPQFVYAKHKLQLSRKDRQLQIDRHNQILLEKMNTIKNSDYTTNKLRPQAQNLKTLNAYTMNTMNDQIITENRRFCEKLMRTKSFYPTNNILDKSDHLQYVGGNISFNARRAMSAKSLNIKSLRPRSSYTTGYSSQKFKEKSARDHQSTQNFKYVSKLEKQQPNNQQHQIAKSRPQTAPMFSRSQKVLVVPKSGRVKVMDVQKAQML